MTYPTNEEREEAHRMGAAAKSIFDNPFHREYPNPSKKGLKDEILATHWVDGYCNQPYPAAGESSPEEKK